MNDKVIARSDSDETISKQSGMSLIVKTVASWVKGLIFLFGLYIIFFGHLTPGGGFPGGVILASSYILLTLAFGSDFSLKNLKETIAAELDSAGAILFLFIALLGFFWGGVFFLNFIHRFNAGQNFRLLSAGTIPLSNIAISIKVSMGVFAVVIALSLFKIVLKKDK